jgi:hypothetical protein
VTPEQIIGATIGALVVIGGGTVAIFSLLKKLGITGSCLGECPDPKCQGFVQETRDNAVAAAEAVINARESISALKQGQDDVRVILDRKRIKIEELTESTTEIKTDVKWIVRELSDKNSK